MGLLEVAAQRRSGQHLLVLFLGSTIGNFDRPDGIQFLAESITTNNQEILVCK